MGFQICGYYPSSTGHVVACIYTVNFTIKATYTHSVSSRVTKFGTGMFQEGRVRSYPKVQGPSAPIFWNLITPHSNQTLHSD